MLFELTFVSFTPPPPQKKTRVIFSYLLSDDPINLTLICAVESLILTKKNPVYSRDLFNILKKRPPQCLIYSVGKICDRKKLKGGGGESNKYIPQSHVQYVKSFSFY